MFCIFQYFSSHSTKHNGRHNRHTHGCCQWKWPPSALHEALRSTPTHQMDGPQPSKLADVFWGGIEGLVGNSDFCFQFLGTPSEAEFKFRFWFQRLWLDFFLNFNVEKSRNQNSDSKIWNSKKNGRRNSIHLISHKISIVIGQPVDLTMLNCMDVGTIPGKAIFVPIHHLLNMSRCDFFGINDHATKLTSRVLKMSGGDFCGMIILPAKNRIYPGWVMLNDCQQDCFAGDCTYIHTNKHRWVYQLRYTTRYLFGRPKEYWWQEYFPIHEIGRINGGRGFQIKGNVFRIGGNTFYYRKNKIPINIPEFKRSRIGLIAEFHEISNGFPNQDWGCVWPSKRSFVPAMMHRHNIGVFWGPYTPSTAPKIISAYLGGCWPSIWCIGLECKASCGALGALSASGGHGLLRLCWWMLAIGGWGQIDLLKK